MTFNQWCAGKQVDRSTRLAFEAVWNAMIANGIAPASCAPLLTDLYEAIYEAIEDAYQGASDDAF